MFLNAGSPVRSCTPTIKRSNKFLTKHEFIDENESNRLTATNGMMTRYNAITEKSAGGEYVMC